MLKFLFHSGASPHGSTGRKRRLFPKSRDKARCIAVPATQIYCCPTGTTGVPMSASIFAAVEMAPRDPILGLNEAFAADTRAEKVNLGVGVYYDDNGKIPLLAAVRTAEKARLEAMPPRGYQPIEGPAAYNNAVQGLLFGKDSQLATSGQTVTIEALGGTGALKVGADYLKRLVPGATVYISDPSWENHRALFESAGFPVENYPYYDAATRGVNFAGMKAK